MRHLLACALLLPVIAGAQTLKGTCADPFEADVPATEHLSMQLRAGDVQIVGVDKPGIRVTCTTGEHAPESVKIKLAGGTLHTYGGPDSDIRFRIEVPARIDLYVKLTAGDLTLSGITGSKDVQLRAGDLTIMVDRPEDYRVAEGSVLAGDIRATAFGITKDGLFRSFRKDNPGGKYRLHAVLMAGDLILRQ